MEKIRLNLASDPLRNKRFYHVWQAVLAALLILLAFMAVSIFVKYGLMHRRARTAIRETETQMEKARSEEKQFQAQADAAAKNEKDMVNFINAVIIRKNFSWTGLLSELEGALPDSSYIISLAPSFLDESSLALKIKVVSRSLDDLLSLISNLNARKLKKIRVQNESFNERGQLISEITFNYERTF